MPIEPNPQQYNPTMREHHWIGPINVGQLSDGYMGAKCLTFWSQRAFNNFFADDPDKRDSDTPGMLLVRVLYCAPCWWTLGLTNKVIALVTNQVSPEEMAAMTEASRRIQLDMDKWRDERAKVKWEEQQVRLAAEAEVKRLANVGDHCEKNHKHNRKAE